MIEEAVEVARDYGGSDLLSFYLETLGEELEARERIDEAEGALLEAYDTRVAARGEEDERAIELRAKLAGFYERTGRAEEALGWR